MSNQEVATATPQDTNMASSELVAIVLAAGALAYECQTCDGMWVDERLRHATSAVTEHMEPVPSVPALCWQTGNYFFQGGKHSITLNRQTHQLTCR